MKAGDNRLVMVTMTTIRNVAIVVIERCWMLGNIQYLTHGLLTDVYICHVTISMPSTSVGSVVHVGCVLNERV